METEKLIKETERLIKETEKLKDDVNCLKTKISYLSKRLEFDKLSLKMLSFIKTFFWIFISILLFSLIINPVIILVAEIFKVELPDSTIQLMQRNVTLLIITIISIVVLLCFSISVKFFTKTKKKKSKNIL